MASPNPKESLVWINDEYVERIEYETSEAFDQAIAAIEKAREELDDLQTELTRGYRDDVWRRPGSVEGVDAGAIFKARNMIEQRAILRRETQKGEQD